MNSGEHLSSVYIHTNRLACTLLSFSPECLILDGVDPSDFHVDEDENVVLLTNTSIVVAKGSNKVSSIDVGYSPVTVDRHPSKPEYAIGGKVRSLYTMPSSTHNALVHSQCPHPLTMPSSTHNVVLIHSPCRIMLCTFSHSMGVTWWRRMCSSSQRKFPVCDFPPVVTT